jgi:predicted DNA-binding transcriptional regulator YafY
LAPPSDEPGSEGWVTLDVPFDDEAQAAFFVLGLGPKVDVVQPASPRARVAADHAAAIARSTG